MIRLVIFDVDGTLVDSEVQIVGAMQAAFAAVGRPVPDHGAVLSIVGLSLPEAIARLSPNLDQTACTEIVEAYRAAFLADPAVPKLYPQARETIEDLSHREGLLLSVATGKARRGAIRLLDQLALTPHFNSIHGGDEHPSKPDPAMLHAAMAAAEVMPAETLMIGDSVFDIEMASAAGVRSLGVSWGFYPPATLTEHGATGILDRFDVLPGMIDTFGGVTA